jgi:transposase-like protein
MTDTTAQSIPQNAADTQGARRATEVSSASGAEPTRISSEVLEKAARRTFTAEYKQRILTQADACSEPGCIGKLLRSEGLYSSHLNKWRTEREQAIRAGLSKPRGRKPQESNPVAEENARLQGEVQRLQTRLMQAEAIIDVQKKLSQLLGLGEISASSGMAL